MFAARLTLLAAAALCVLGAQYPPPVYPGGQARLPIPRPGKSKGDRPEKTAPVRTYEGTVESTTPEKLVVATGDGRTLEFTCDKDTKYFHAGEEVKRESLARGARVSVEGRQNNEGFLFAVSVRVEKAAPRTEAGPAAGEQEETATVVRPSPSRTPRDPDDPGPPILQRGKPKRIGTEQAEETAVTASGAPPAQSEPREDERIVKAREAAGGFTESLPNYIVQQMTTRYYTDSVKADWKAQDILSAEVVYENGRESYRNIRIDNKPVKKPLEAVGGSVSHGEFGSTLADLFSPGTLARFSRRSQSRVSGHPAMKYDFEVALPHSHWQIRYGGQTIRPAYRGSVWIALEDARVLRIEMQARQLPEDYPLDAIEWVVEYGSVRIGPNQYLLPVEAENLACLRGTSRCTRNTTFFRNYRRFTAESQVFTTDSTIDFGEQVPGETKPGPK